MSLPPTELLAFGLLAVIAVLLCVGAVVLVLMLIGAFS